MDTDLPPLKTPWDAAGDPATHNSVEGLPFVKRIASIILFDKYGDVYLVNRYSPKQLQALRNQYEDQSIGFEDDRLEKYYDLPGGAIDEGEDAAEAIIREAEEELGIKIDPAQLIHMGKHKLPRHPRVNSPRIRELFLLSDDGYTGDIHNKAGHAEGHIDVKPFRKDQAYRLLGRRLDAQTRHMLDQLCFAGNDNFKREDNPFIPR